MAIRHPPPYRVTLLPPISYERPIPRGQVLHIGFVVEEPATGEFIEDETVEALIADEAGDVIVNASLKSVPPISIDTANKAYRLDWETEHKAEGTYVLGIYFRGASVLHVPIFLS